MKKRVALALLALVLITGAACSNSQTGTPGGWPSAQVSIDDKTKTADLTGRDAQEAITLAKDLVADANVEAVKIDAGDWTSEQLVELHEACPDFTIVGTHVAGSMDVALDATELDVSDASPEDLESLSTFCSCLTKLETLNAGSEEGHVKLASLAKIKQACPDVKLSYTFSAHDKNFDINETRLDFRRVPMDDNGDEVRELLGLMPWVKYVDMDSCGVDDEHMAALRDDFPEVEVVWRVWFGTNYTVRTDATKILASAPGLGGLLSPENTQSLKYCTKMKYLDIGHNGTLQDISFVSYMPDLEVFICMMGHITDISPLADCKHLEFLEIFTNDITDLTPLSGLTELRHLNASNNPNLSDISPVYELHGLERFWCGHYNSVPQEQFDRFCELNPNCQVNFTCFDPHEDWRWGTERYALLQEQLGYLTYDYQIPENDPLYEPVL